MIAANRQKRNNKTPPPRMTIWPDRSKSSKSARMLVQLEVRMLKLPKSTSFANIHNPILSPRKKKMIEAKLQNEREAEKLARDRIEDNKKFINYEKNPFMHIDDPARPPLEEEIKFNKFTKFHDEDGRHLQYKMQENIIDAANAIQENKFIVGKRKGGENVKSMTKFSAKMTRDVKARKDSQVEHWDEESFETHKQLSLDEIVSMKDENFYASHQIPINIFKVATGNHMPFLTNYVLDSSHFCKRQVRQSMDTKFKVQFYRQVSDIGRSFARGKANNLNALEYITSYEMSFNVNNMNFTDLISVASGRFSPELIRKAMENGDTVVDTSNTSEVLEWEIPYNENTNQKLMNFNARNMERYEVEDYKKMELSKEQYRFHKRCQHLLEEVDNKMKQQTVMTERQIRDQNLHKKLTTEIDKNVTDLMLMDQMRMGVDRKIRHHKQSKNKKEVLKIRKLLQSIQLKNAHEQSIKILLKDIYR